MAIGWILGGLVLAALFAGALALAWWMYKRPMDAWAWGTRRGLLRAGLKKHSVPAPAGPQAVFVGGAGPVLVFLHGAGDQAGTWHAAAKALVRGHTVIVPDLAGHGDSAPQEGPIQAADIFAGLEAVLERHAPDRPVTLVGNSLGAWMALVYASRHPERVDRVVAVNGGPLVGDNTKVRMLPTTRAEARETMAQLRDPGAKPLPDPVLDDLVRLARSGPLPRFAAAALGMVAWVMTEEQLRTLKVPVKVVWGLSDQLMPVAYAQRMLAALPDAEYFPIEACGHVPQQEAPERFLDALRRALA